MCIIILQGSPGLVNWQTYLTESGANFANIGGGPGTTAALLGVNPSGPSAPLYFRWSISPNPAASATPAGMLVDGLSGSSGATVTQRNPVFSWELGNDSQSGYEILIATSPRCWPPARQMSGTAARSRGHLAEHPLLGDGGAAEQHHLLLDGAHVGQLGQCLLPCPRAILCHRHAHGHLCDPIPPGWSRSRSRLSSSSGWVAARISPISAMTRGNRHAHHLLARGRAGGDRADGRGAERFGYRRCVAALGFRTSGINRRTSPCQNGVTTYTVTPTWSALYSGYVSPPSYIGQVTPFRYIEVKNVPAPFTASDITQLAVHVPFNNSAATFTSSDPLLKRDMEPVQTHDHCHDL